MRMTPGCYPARRVRNLPIGLLLTPKQENRSDSRMGKNLDRWLHSWIFRRRSSLPVKRHVFIAVCDHFEPFHGGSKALAMDRTRRWKRELRYFADDFRDSDGIP